MVVKCAALLSIAALPFIFASRAGASQIDGRTGAELFANYCANCHGADGKGGGPRAIALKLQPPDLTTIAQRNGGTFPTARIRALVAGPDDLFIPAHGSSQMPVWGPIFRALDPTGDNAGRLAKIVDYLGSLQHDGKAGPVKR